jgi:hypothetical protein
LIALRVVVQYAPDIEEQFAAGLKYPVRQGSG